MLSYYPPFTILHYPFTILFLNILFPHLFLRNVIGTAYWNTFFKKCSHVSLCSLQIKAFRDVLEF